MFAILEYGLSTMCDHSANCREVLQVDSNDVKAWIIFPWNIHLSSSIIHHSLCAVSITPVEESEEIQKKITQGSGFKQKHHS